MFSFYRATLQAVGRLWVLVHTLDADNSVVGGFFAFFPRINYRQGAFDPIQSTETGPIQSEVQSAGGVQDSPESFTLAPRRATI
jgi:hypothetical protein